MENKPPPSPPLLGERRKEARAMWDAIPVKVGRKPFSNPVSRDRARRNGANRFAHVAPLPPIDLR